MTSYPQEYFLQVIEGDAEPLPLPDELVEKRHSLQLPL